MERPGRGRLARRRRPPAPRDDGGGPGPASDYPPTAYAWQALGYAAAAGGTLFDELLGARLMSALWVPLTVLAHVAAGGRGLRPPAAAADGRGGGARAAADVHVHLGVGQPRRDDVRDSGRSRCGSACAASSAACRCARRSAFFALVGLACTVKTTSYALLVPAALRRRGRASRRAGRGGSAACSSSPLPSRFRSPSRSASGCLRRGLENRPAAAQVAAATASSSGTNWRELLSYLWQYYLPKTPVQTEYRVPPGGYPLLQVWITQAWGAFGWLEVKFAPMVYRVLAILTVGVFGAALRRAVAGAPRRRPARARVPRARVLRAARRPALDRLPPARGRVPWGSCRAATCSPSSAIFGLALAGAVSLLPVARRGAATGAASPACSSSTSSRSASCWSRFYA